MKENNANNMQNNRTNNMSLLWGSNLSLQQK